MAEEVDLQRLIVSFEANQKQFNSQLEKIDRKLAGATKSMERNLKSTASASAAVAGAFRAMIPAVTVAGLLKLGRHALDVADKIDKLAISTGLSRERIQTLSFASEQLGVDADTATKGFERFSRALGEFKNTGAGPAKDALEQLGLANSVLSGELPDTESALDAVVTALDGVKDGNRQAALAAKLFGDEVGPKFARLLASGADGLRKLEDQARSLGLVMSDDLIAKSVEARDKLDALSAVVDAKATVAFAQFAPAIADVADALLDVITWSAAAGRALQTFFDDLARENEDAAKRLREVFANNIFTGPTVRFLTQPPSAGGAAAATADPAPAPDPADSGASDISKLLGETTSAKIAKVAAEMERIQRAIDGGTLSAQEQAQAFEALAEKQEQINKLRDGGSQGGDGEDFERMIAASKARTQALQDEEAAAGLTGGELARLEEKQRLLNEMTSAGISLNRENVAAVEAAADAYARQAEETAAVVEQEENLSRYHDDIGSLEDYTAALENQVDVMQRFGVSASIAATAASLLAEAQAAGIPVTDELVASTVALAQGAEDARDAVDAMADAQSASEDAAKSFGRSVQISLSGFINDLKEGKSLTESLANAFSNLADQALNIALNLAFKGLGASLGVPLGFASGGYVSGPGTGTSDSVPAYLSDGEFVVNAAATRKYRDVLESINNGDLPAFAQGGLVTRATMPRIDMSPRINVAAAAAPAVNVPPPIVHLKNVNLIDPVDMLRQALASREGERVLVNKFQQSNSAFKQALGTK